MVIVKGKIDKCEAASCGTLVGSYTIIEDQDHAAKRECDKYLPIEVINNSGVIESVISDLLSQMGPVLLFYMGIVVFVIGTAAGKDNGPLSFGKMSEEMVIQKLGTVIAVKTEDSSLFPRD